MTLANHASSLPAKCLDSSMYRVVARIGARHLSTRSLVKYEIGPGLLQAPGLLEKCEALCQAAPQAAIELTETSEKISNFMGLESSHIFPLEMTHGNVDVVRNMMKRSFKSSHRDSSRACWKQQA